MTTVPTFIFAGGGTGGHLFPGIALTEELRRRLPPARMLFVGSEREIESKIIARHNLEHAVLSVEQLATLKRNPLRFIARNWRALQTAKQILSERCPAAVIGLGGYASAPLVWAAHRQKIPVILLEQNVIPGRTTRWLSRYASHVCVSFEETRSRLPQARHVVVTGNPVRNEIAALCGQSSDTDSSTAANAQPRLLILGGSQGADSLNHAVLLVADELRQSLANWKIVHQTGPRLVDVARETYGRLGLTAVVEPFFDNMPQQYAQATVVISRAGATTLAELACAGTAMILLPYPLAMDNHQQANAEVLANRSAAIIVKHSSLAADTAGELSVALRQLLEDPGQRQTMSDAVRPFACPFAAKKIVDLILATVH